MLQRLLMKKTVREDTAGTQAHRFAIKLGQPQNGMNIKICFDLGKASDVFVDDCLTWHTHLLHQLHLIRKQFIE